MNTETSLDYSLRLESIVVFTMKMMTRIISSKNPRNINMFYVFLGHI